MISVVKSSSSVYSTYISTVDHLPCDIVRSLWLVQACNLAADTEKQKLDESLKEYQRIELELQKIKENISKEYRERQSNITRWNNEALAELENLDVQMKTHEVMLRRGVDSLKDDSQNTPSSDQRSRSELLKSQLDDHYRENPLVSQIEALQERVLKGSRNVIIKHVPGQATGVKIILKLPKTQKKVSGSGPAGTVAVPKARSSTQSQDAQMSSQPLSPTPKTAKTTENVEAAPSRKRGRPRRLSSDTAVDVGKTPKTVVPKKTPLLKISLPRSQPATSESSESPTKFATPAEVTLTKTDNSNESEQYCFCHQESSGDMIACDYQKCPNGEWFHYKCVGLSRADAKKFESQKWFCSDSCKVDAEKHKPKRKKRKTKW